MKKILISGTDGFIGRHLEETMAKRADFQLLCPRLLILNLTKTTEVANYLETHRPDIIIHSATANTVGKGYESDVCEQNLRMFFNLVHHRPKGSILYTLCSGSSYNRENWVENMSEDYLGKFIPSDGQGFSKFVIASHARYLENVVTLRLFGIFGRHEDYRYKFISNTIAKRLAGLDVVLAKNAFYHYLDVEDFCTILMRLIDEQVDSGEFNVTPDRAVSLEEIIKTVDNYLAIAKGHTVLSQGLGRAYTGCNKRLRNALPNLAFTPIEESISRLVGHYRQHIEDIDRVALSQDLLLQHARSISRT